MAGPTGLAALVPERVAGRLVFEFAGTGLLEPDIVAAARGLVAAGHLIGLAIDDRLAGLDALSTGLSFEVVRFARVPGDDQVHGRMAMTIARQLRDEGCAVVVDGIPDRRVADHLRRSRIGLGQGPVFDDVDGRWQAGSAPTRASGWSVPMPPVEQERMELLVASRVLDSGRELHFDFVVEEAAERCSTPISLLSMIDSDRQWFKASVGLEVSQTPRDWAFCAYTICGPEPFVVPDAAIDGRFQANPLVLGPPYIRSYLGVPLMASSGVAFGSLCVIDVVPRRFDDREINQLCMLASLVADSIELRAHVDPAP